MSRSGHRHGLAGDHQFCDPSRAVPMMQDRRKSCIPVQINGLVSSSLVARGHRVAARTGPSAASIEPSTPVIMFSRRSPRFSG